MKTYPQLTLQIEKLPDVKTKINDNFIEGWIGGLTTVQKYNWTEMNIGFYLNNKKFNHKHPLTFDNGFIKALEWILKE